MSKRVVKKKPKRTRRITRPPDSTKIAVSQRIPGVPKGGER